MKYLLYVALPLLLAGCANMDGINLPVLSKSPRERYERALMEGPLVGSELVDRWREAGRRALEDSVRVLTPFLEKGYFRAARPQALGYRLTLKSGTAVRVQLEAVPDSIEIFGDLFRVDLADTVVRYQYLGSIDETSRVLEHEISRDGEYVLRVQPELLADCRFELTLTQYPPLNFPVKDRGNKDVGSFWGDEREGGRRSHEGVDIFAPRGTPVVAISEGYVTRVGEGGLGGKVVWVRDNKRGFSLYYAHLDSQLVSTGRRVRPGDTLGLVGNTGNARTTSPHLHFGIYVWGRGAIDPLPFIYEHSQTPTAVTADQDWLGREARTAGRAADLLARAGGKRAAATRLSPYTALDVIGASGPYVRVRLVDGRSGYLPANGLQTFEKSIDRITLAEAVEVKSRPGTFAAPVASVEAGTRLPVLARAPGFAYVDLPDGSRGWIRLDRS